MFFGSTAARIPGAPGGRATWLPPTRSSTPPPLTPARGRHAHRGTPARGRRGGRPRPVGPDDVPSLDTLVGAPEGPPRGRRPSEGARAGPPRAAAGAGGFRARLHAPPHDRPVHDPEGPGQRGSAKPVPGAPGPGVPADARGGPKGPPRDPRVQLFVNFTIHSLDEWGAVLPRGAHRGRTRLEGRRAGDDLLASRSARSSCCREAGRRLRDAGRGARHHGRSSRR